MIGDVSIISIVVIMWLWYQLGMHVESAGIFKSNGDDK